MLALMGLDPAIPIECLLTVTESFVSSMRVKMAGTSQTSPAMTGLESQSLRRLVIKTESPAEEQGFGLNSAAVAIPYSLSDLAPLAN